MHSPAMVVSNMPHMLVIDDSIELHALTDCHLAGTGIGLAHANSGAEGLAMAQVRKPDLILLDLEMPEWNGIETLRQLRASLKYRLPPVVVLTDCEDQKEVADAFAEGAIDFLRKPLLQVELQARIKCVLKTHAMLHRLRFLSHNDPLTGLPNRNGMCQWIDNAVEQPAHFPCPYAALVIGVDAVNDITDSLGMGANEELLRGVAHHLRTTLAQHGDQELPSNRYHLARGNGDSFVVLLCGADGTRSSLSFATRLAEALATGYKISNETKFASVSIGVAFAQEATADFHKLIRCADIALQSARRAGRSNVHLYALPMEDALRQRVILENELRETTKTHSFELRYQPVINLQTWAFEGVETILHWDHPIHSGIPATKLRALTGEMGLCGEVHSWMLANACQQFSQWIYEAPTNSPRRNGLHISRKQLFDPLFLETALMTLKKNRLRTDRVQFEIDEEIVMCDPTAAMDAMRRLREAGIRLVIDGFGSAFPSFHYLDQFPVDGIKLSPLLIQNLESNPCIPKLLEMIHKHATQSNLSVCVDGVASEEQAKQLRGLGFRWAQGTLFSRPIQGSALMPFFKNWNANLSSPSRSQQANKSTSTASPQLAT